MKWLWKWGHPHTLATGFIVGMSVLSGHPWIVAAAFALAYLAGAATALALIGVWRVTKRIDRALPDSAFGHPCAQCNRAITGRAKYCSETCREIAADERAARRRQAQRFEEYGEVPF